MSRLTVERRLPDHAKLSAFPIRTTTVLWPRASGWFRQGLLIPNPVQHHVIVLDGFHLGLDPGQRVIVTGEQDDLRAP